MVEIHSLTLNGPRLIAHCRMLNILVYSCTVLLRIHNNLKNNENSINKSLSRYFKDHYQFSVEVRFTNARCKT